MAATTLGTSPTGRPHATVMGPRLRLTVSGGTFAASLDDDIQEAATLDELREAGTEPGRGWWDRNGRRGRRR